MSLVAYGSSDESGEESEDGEHEGLGLQRDVGLVVRTEPVCKTTRPTSNPSPSRNACVALGVDSILDEDEEHYSQSSNTPRPTSSLFQTLPKPKQNICEIIDEDEQLESLGDIVPVGLLAFPPEPQGSSDLFIPRSSLGSDRSKNLNKRMGTVKITLPSLSQFDDEKEDEPVKKKLKPSQKGSGLFAILPAPKNMKLREAQQPFVPYVLTKKPTLPVITPGQNKKSKRSLGRPSSPEAGNISEDEGEKDFFSLNSALNLPSETIATDSSTTVGPVGPHRFSSMVEHESDGATTGVHSSRPNEEEPLAFHSGFLPTPWANESHVPGPSRAPINSQDYSNSKEQWTSQEPSSSIPQENLQLDAEAMQRLCGRRSKKHQEAVEFIDVSGKEIMPDPNDWLVKQLSEEQPKMRSHSHKRNDGPTTQQRRKHQITYLAFQAKENELELKNQWSQNRMSRKQTQSKYGF